MPAQISSTPKTPIFKSESHKLHDAYEVKAGNSVKTGQPVKLDPTGTIVPAGAAETNVNIIGIAIMDGAAGDTVTVMTKGYAIIWCEAEGAVVAGPVKTGTGMGTTYLQVTDDTVGDANAFGWCLDAVADTMECRVLIRA